MTESSMAKGKTIKLKYKTIQYYTIWIIPMLILCMISAYFTIQYIAYNEIDEALLFSKERIEKDWEEYNILPEGFAEIERVAEPFEPFYSDTLLLERGDNEMIPHRLLMFCLSDNDRHLRITLDMLLFGTDDVVQGAFILSLTFLAFIILGLMSLNGIVNKIWRPFNNTLLKLNTFSVTDEQLPEFPETDVQEFRMLNAQLTRMMGRTKNDYENAKEFNENASHELQTHLALVRVELDELITKASDKEEIMQPLSRAFNTVSKLSNVIKGLLLISKINNKELDKSEAINLRSEIESDAEIFKETAEIRDISFNMDFKNNAIILADKSLMNILFSNLLKNAVVHNHQNGFVNISLQGSVFEISNSCKEVLNDVSRAFERSVKGESGNTGIGLSLVKHICNLCKIEIQYTVEGDVHKFTLDFSNLVIQKNGHKN
ncbi:MAG: sensor histidine kinase [Bacteroidales bacterium]